MITCALFAATPTAAPHAPGLFEGSLFPFAVFLIVVGVASLLWVLFFWDPRLIADFDELFVALFISEPAARWMGGVGAVGTFAAGIVLAVQHYRGGAGH